MPLLRNRAVLAFSCAGIAAIAALVAGCRDGASGPASPVSSGAAGADVPGPGAIQHADESNFAELVLRTQGPVLVDFYADWCGPCKVQAPILDDFARQTPHVSVVKVDVDQAPGLAQEYEIRAIPSLRVFRDGQIVAEHAGVAKLDELRSLMGI